MILTHQNAAAVRNMTEYWSSYIPRASILIAYGGKREDFDAIEFERKFFVNDPQLRTRDHQREFQSYTPILRAAAACLAADDYRFVHFVEYDHIPIAAELNGRLVERLEGEKADLLGYGVHRVDCTSNPHYLYHVQQPEFPAFWSRISRRREKGVVLSCFGTGTFWTLEAFIEVASIENAPRCYMELYLPTVAHHLGFRVRDLPDQNQFVRASEGDITSIDEARARGAWTLHPLKSLWSK